jgi:hypothetical protein
MRVAMTALVATKFFFFACESMHQSGQSNRRNFSSSVKVTNAAQWPQMEGSPGFGWVDLLRDQFSECPHSGHCHAAFSLERNICSNYRSP